MKKSIWAIPNNKLFSIGGDEDMKPANSKANRFKPVVKFIGPFALKKGEEQSHKLKLPPYIGSVRVMAVAGQDGAYGKAEKTVPVRTPLMILSSLPRVVSTDEEIYLPVNVFAMENTVKNVSIKVETTGKLKIANGGSQSLTFAAPGDKMVYFALKSEHGVSCDIVNKDDEPSPNTTELFDSGDVDFVVSTSKIGRKPAMRSVKMRRKAIERNIACLTSLDTADAFVNCLLMEKDIEECEMTTQIGRASCRERV